MHEPIATCPCKTMHHDETSLHAIFGVGVASRYAALRLTVWQA